MANIMLRRNEAGELIFYLPKKDLEETVVSLEHEGPETWGGEIELGDGTRYYIDPVEGAPKLPISARARRISD